MYYNARVNALWTKIMELALQVRAPPCSRAERTPRVVVESIERQKIRIYKNNGM